MEFSLYFCHKSIPNFSIAGLLEKSMRFYFYIFAYISKTAVKNKGRYK